MTTTTLRYRPEIDGLRALAILSVVAYHVGVPGITGGFGGVDVFFVISGFLITQLLVLEVEATGGLSIVGFYVRRARRILPALLIMMLATLVLGHFALPPGEPRADLAGSALASLAFSANHYFLLTTGGYFDGPSELKPLLHLWSLAVEEQFYIVWPLLVMLAAWLTPSRYRRAVLIVAIAALSVASFILCDRLTFGRVGHPAQLDHSLAFFLAPARAWELGVGALIALTSSQWAALPRWLGFILSAVGLAMILATFGLLDVNTHFPGKAAWLPVAGTAAVIAGCTSAPRCVIARLLSLKPVVYIGLVSYAWYLWHWPLLSFVRSADLMQPDLLGSLAAGAVSFALAAWTYHFIEVPVRESARLRASSGKRVLAMASGTLAVGALFVLSTQAWERFGPKTQREVTALAAADDHPRTSLWGCMLQTWQGKLPSASTCRFGREEAPLLVALWGDSHAMAWSPLLEQYEKNDRLAFLMLSMAACQPLAADAVHWASTPYKNGCNEFRQAALREILELKRAGLHGVVLAARWQQLWNVSPTDALHLHDESKLAQLFRQRVSGRAADIKRAGLNSPAVPADLTRGLDATLHALQDAGLRVLVMLDPPELPYSVSSCIYYHYRDPYACGETRPAFDRQYLRVASAIRAIAAPYRSVRVFDPATYLCDTSYCVAFRDGHGTLWDTDHVSASLARSFAPAMENDMRWLAGQ